MSAVTAPTFRTGFRRGLIEYRNVLQMPSEVGYMAVGLVITVAVLFFLRDATVEGLDLPIMYFAFPGVLAMQILLAGGYGAAVVVATDREDGTLLRMKSAPTGSAVYVVGMLVRVLIDVIVGLAS